MSSGTLIPNLTHLDGIRYAENVEKIASPGSVNSLTSAGQASRDLADCV